MRPTCLSYASDTVESGVVTMPHVAMVQYEDASPEVQEIYDEILAVRGQDGLSNFWKTLAFHPPTLRRNWNQASYIVAT